MYRASGNPGAHFPFLGREDEVCIHGKHGAGSLDGAQGCLHAAAAAPHIVAVQGVAEGEIGVGVKAPAHELLSLVALVGGGAAGKEGVGVFLGLGELVAPEASVADKGLRPGAFEAFRSAVQAAWLRGRWDRPPGPSAGLPPWRPGRERCGERCTGKDTGRSVPVP